MTTNRDAAADFSDELLTRMAETLVQAERIVQEAVTVACEAIIDGNSYGPGVPVDTGELRATWQVGVGALGGETYSPSVIGAWSPFDGDLFLTSPKVYAEPLELGGIAGTHQRRTGPQQLKNLKGTGIGTQFVEPVEQRWPAILDDAAARVKPAGDS